MQDLVSELPRIPLPRLSEKDSRALRVRATMAKNAYRDLSWPSI
jgi:hypothetical protein